MSEHTPPTLPGTDSTLLDLYANMRELCECCFFLCDALDGMLSTELALEAETIGGIRLTTDWIKRRAREVTRRLRAVCEGRGGW